MQSLKKKLTEYHDSYVQSDTLLLADIFKNFRNTHLKIYELDPAKFLSASGLAWKGTLKQRKVKFDLLTDIDMLLMVEKDVRVGTCHSTFDVQKLITNRWKIMIKIKNCHIFNIGM